MYIAHSALRSKNKNGIPALADEQLQQRLEAYRAACKKYEQEIIAIQKYLPGWVPEFRVNS
jgi:hypothetical protein